MAEWLRRIRTLILRRRLEDQLAEEIRVHLELRRQQLIEDGLDPRSAGLEARRVFGNATAIREQARDMWGWRWIDTLTQDLRYGARLLRRSPAFTAVAVTSLAVGIGSVAAVFNAADAALFRPIAVKAPHELRHFQATLSFGAGRKVLGGMPPSTLLEMQRAGGVGELVGFRSIEAVTMVPAGGAPRLVRVELVSANYFDVLGVAPAAGRLPTHADQPTASTIVLSERLWRTVFHGEPSVPGRTVTLNGTPVIVGGVVRVFRGLMADQPADIFLQLSAASLVDSAGATAPVRVVARLPPTIAPAVAEQKAAVLFQGAAPSMSRGDELRVALLDASRGVSDVRASLEQPLLIGLGFVAVLLLVACANTGGLLLARFAFRRGEFAVRVAIGAGRSRLIRQLVVESLLLACIAAIVGLLVAWVAAPLLLRAIPIGSVAPGFDVRFDWRLIAFTAAASAVAGLVAACASLWRLLGSDPSHMVLTEARSAAPGRRRPTQALIAAQIACSLLLIVGAGSITRSLMNLRAVDPGFDTAGMFALTADATGRASDPTALREYFGRLHERIASAAHVERVSLVQFPLLAGAATTGTVDVPGFAPATDDDRWVRMFFVGPEFFETLGMRLLLGRDFSRADATRGERIAVVNREFARFYFGDPSLAVGRTINRDVRIVGVAADARYGTLRDEPVRAVFLPYRQAPSRSSMTFIVRSAGDRQLAISAATETVRKYDSELRIKVTTLEDQVTATLSRERFVAVLGAGLSGLALFLSCAGLYGAVSYAVSERRGELAIRLAVGATRGHIVRLMLIEPMRTAALGVAVGVPAVYVVMRGLSSLLFHVSPFDAWTLLPAAAGLMTVAAAAALWPARRASAIDPLECLKCR